MTPRSNWESRVGRRLKLRHLHIFSTVVACGSMAKAAATLRVSQPTVSEVIADLEHTFGVRLLDRGPRGVELTAYGAALLRRSTAAFDELEQTSRDIAFLADPTVGDVRVGCTPTFAAADLPCILRRFFEQYPRVVVHVEDMPSPALQHAALRDRRCDLILARIVPPVLADQEDLNVELLYNDRLLVVADARNRWTRRRTVDLADLVDEPWLLAAPHTWTYRQLEDAFHARGVEMPKASLVTQSVPVRVNLLADGRYLTVFGGSTLRLYAKRYSLKALAVDLPDCPWPVVIATLKRRSLSPLAERFAACAREATKSIARPESRTG
jgi:DNA-binding transcriptional LysR family regulator